VARRSCVLDASLVIALGKAGHADILRKVRSFEWHIGAIARGELVKPATKRPVEQMIAEGVVKPVELDADDAAGMTLFAQWSESLDPGEAESVTIALSNGWLVGLEDLAAQRRLDRISGPGHWINCANVLIAAIREGGLTLVDADAIFAKLDVFSGYAKRGVTSLNQIHPTG
jgi:hypothetical protein